MKRKETENSKNPPETIVKQSKQSIPMRVAMYYNNKDIRIQEMPIPEIGPKELLLKVMACGICGSDVMEWYRIKKAPLVLGHEASGFVEQVGSDVKRFKEGDRIFVTHHVPCNTCRFCLDSHHTACDTLHTTNFFPGGFSEYVRIPEINLDRGTFLLPEEMSFEEATFIEPLGTVIRGHRMARYSPGQSVLVIGSGIAGILHIQLAKALGAGRIFATDINDYRLKKAEEFGADMAIDGQQDVPSIIKESNGGRLADRVFVCAGSVPAAQQAMKCVDRGGIVEFFAVPRPGEDVPAPLNNMWRDEVSITTSYGAAPNDLSQAIELLKARRINVEDMITHRLPLEETARGFQLVAEGQESLKVIIYPRGVVNESSQ